jgi:hypothetical protein
MINNLISEMRGLKTIKYDKSYHDLNRDVGVCISVRIQMGLIFCF